MPMCPVDLKRFHDTEQAHNTYMNIVPSNSMVTETQQDGMTWYECEECGMLFDTRADAEEHEQGCDAEEPSYIQ